MSSTDAQLRETLRQLDQARAGEAAWRRESEAILAGLRIMDAGTNTAAMLGELLEVLRGVLGFDAALIALPDRAGHRIAAATPAAMHEIAWPTDADVPSAPQAVAGLSGPLSVFRLHGEHALLAPLAPIVVEDRSGALLLLYRRPVSAENLDTLHRLMPLLDRAAIASRARGLGVNRTRFPEENPRPVARSDRAGRILYANPPAWRLLASMGEHTSHLPPEWARWMQTSMRGNTSVETETRAGDRIWSLAVAPFPDRDYANFYLTDITERRLAEEELVRSSSRISALVSHQHAGILVEDEHRRIVLTNQAMCDLFAIPVPPEVLYGSSCAAAMIAAQEHFASPAAFAAGVTEALAAGRERLGEELELADGRVLERDYIPIRIGAEEGGHLWQYRDVTERRLAQEELLRAKAAAERANDAKSEFLARTSHEIRTPLNAVLGMTELVMESELSDEQRSWLRGAHANSQALLHLINDILDLSRIESGQVRLERKSFDPQALTEDIAEAFAARAAGRGLELGCVVDPAVPGAVLGDANRVRQVLSNLMGNAIKYTDQGDVTLALRVCGGNTPRLRWVVTDTGTGIAPEEIDRIFERYTQARSSRPGTGLGLHIVRHLVLMMDGELSVDSTVGEGSRFAVDLPLPVLRSAPPPLKPGLREALEGLAVLFLVPDAGRLARLTARVAGTGLILDAYDGSDPIPDAVLDHADVIVADDNISAVLARRVAGRPGVVLLARILGNALGDIFGDHHVRVLKPPRRMELLHGIVRAAVPIGAVDTLAETEPVAEAAETPRVVLVVDDNASNLAVILGYLQSSGHEARIAKNGFEAVVAASSPDVDLVLMDLHMPGMDGFEATRRIRAEARQAGRPPVRVVALTAHATPEVRDQALAAGMDDFLTKPVQRSVILETVARGSETRDGILIVDDAPDMLRLVAHFLKKADYRVLSASGGDAALKVAEAERLSLILMDVEMPDGDGPSTVRALRDRGFTLPVLAMTGHTDTETHASLLDAGYTAVVVKPIDKATLLKSVARWLGTDPGLSTQG